MSEKKLAGARAEVLIKSIIDHVAVNKDKVGQIRRLKTMGFENDDLLCFGYTQQDLEKASGKKKYRVTTGGYATQDGFIMVPANLPAHEVEAYIDSHFDEVEFGEPQIDLINYNFREA